MHAGRDGSLAAFGLYGTDYGCGRRHPHGHAARSVGHQSGSGRDGRRAHAAVFATNGKTLYVASDASDEIIALDPRTGEIFWRLNVPGAHELAITQNGKTRLRDPSHWPTS